MNYISDILYWISTGLLVPVIVLLIILFGRSVLLLGNFFGQYLAIRKTDALMRNELDELNPENTYWFVVKAVPLHGHDSESVCSGFKKIFIENK